MGTHLKHLHHGSSHRLDATRHNRTAGCHLGSWTEHLGEVLRHPPSNILQLDLTIAREFAPTIFGVTHDEIHFMEHLTTCWCQLVKTVGMQHHHIGDIITTAAADITRAMTTVVGDIKGLLTLRRWCQRGGDTIRIDVIVA